MSKLLALALAVGVSLLCWSKLTAYVAVWIGTPDNWIRTTFTFVMLLVVVSLHTWLMEKARNVLINKEKANK